MVKTITIKKHRFDLMLFDDILYKMDNKFIKILNFNVFTTNII